MNDLEIAWLAGLFEGEGSMYIAKNGGTRLTIRSTDKDIVDRVDTMFPCTKIQVVHPKPMKPGYNPPKTQYAWRVSRPETVREVLELLLPWLGERRSARAREVLDHLATRPGTGSYQRNKTHCPQGHEYTPENTIIRPGTTHRRCRICVRKWDRRARERKRAGGLQEGAHTHPPAIPRN